MADNTASLSIDFKAAQIQISGSEEFIRDMLPNLREWIADYAESVEMDEDEDSTNLSLAHTGGTNGSSSGLQDLNGPVATRTIAKPASKPNNTVRARKPATAITIAQPVSIQGDGNKPSLADFLAMKRPGKGNHTEIGMVMAYYLIKQAGLSSLLPGHILACYEELGIKKPTDFEALLRNIKGKKNWLMGTKATGYTLTHAGDNFVAHDLPQEKKG